MQFRTTTAVTILTMVLALSTASITVKRGIADDWPKFSKSPANVAKCIPVGAQCATCPGVIGCDSQIPATWAVGQCQPVAPAAGKPYCLQSQNFQCGNSIDCSTMNPDGGGCNPAVICKQSA